MASIMDIEGIGEHYAEILKTKAGIRTTEALLKACATPAARQELAEKTGISPKLILEWANLADLMRIKGVGEEYSDLLEEAGVDTVKELKTRVPKHLYEKMAEINAEKHLVRRLPTLHMVESWVEQARHLPPALEY
jgi:predicted flap endonuclease-1-like 5' DNA nuclease